MFFFTLNDKMHEMYMNGDVSGKFTSNDKQEDGVSLCERVASPLVAESMMRSQLSEGSRSGRYNSATCVSFSSSCHLLLLQIALLSFRVPFFSFFVLT